MRVAADHDVDGRVEPVDDAEDGPTKIRTAGVIEARRTGETAFVDQQHDGFDAGSADLGHHAIDRLGFVEELEPGGGFATHQLRRTAQHRTDEGDVDFTTTGNHYALACPRGKQQPARRLHAHVRRQVLEVRTLRQALQLAHAAIEFMVADGSELEAGRTQRIDRWLVLQQRTGERRTADEITGCDHDRRWMRTSQCLYSTGEPGHAAGGQLQVRRTRLGARHARGRARRIEMTVEIIERDQLDAERCAARDARCRRGAGRKQAQQQHAAQFHLGTEPSTPSTYQSMDISCSCVMVVPAGTRSLPVLSFSGPV